MTYDFLPLGDAGCPKCAGKPNYCEECIEKILAYYAAFGEDDDESEE